MLNHGNSLIYHSAPFEQATELTGFFTLSAWVEMDRPDTDFAVAVSEIKADGSAVALSTDFLRARYRESLRGAKLVPAGRVLLYDFNGFTFISRVVAKGSRLRLAFGPPDSIYLQKNFHSGGEVARETNKDARPVRVRLYHDGKHPSVLSVPIGASE